MSLKPGASYYVDFTTETVAGVATDADSTPTVVIYVNNAVDDWGESVANIGTGHYRVSGTVAADLSAGDVFSTVVSATVDGVSGKATVDHGTIDTKRNADLNDLAAGAEMDFVDAPNGTAITAIQSGLSTAEALTTHDGKLDTADAIADAHRYMESNEQKGKFEKQGSYGPDTVTVEVS